MTLAVRFLAAVAVLAATVPGIAQTRELGEVRFAIETAGNEPLEVWRWGLVAGERIDGAVGETAFVTRAHPCGEPSRYVVTTPTKIASSPVVDCGANAQLIFAPALRMTVRFKVRGVDMPAFGLAQANCKPAVIDVPFAIGKDGAAVVVVPEACADATLAVRGFAAHQIVLTGEPLQDIGTIELANAAAASLRIVSSADGKPLDGVIVEVVRASDFEKVRAERSAAPPQRVARAVSGADGWIRLSNLPPEDVVFAVARSEGKHRAYTPVYRLRTDRSLVVDPLQVAPPAKVSATVWLSDEMADDVSVMALRFEPRGELAWPVHTAFDVVANGRNPIAVDDVPPGPWSVSAVVRLPGGAGVRTASKEIDVAPGAVAEVSLRVADRIFRGRLTRGRQGIPGVINLKPYPSSPGRRNVTTRSEDDGRFAVLLEGPGEYSAVIQTASGGARFDRGVRFDEGETKIELAAGRIEGKVVTSGGAPVAEADVVATLRTKAGGSEVSEAFTRSGSDGTFAVDFVGGGSWLLTASRRSLTSDPTPVQVHVNEHLTGITIVVHQTHTVAIRVADARGINVSGAWVGLESATPLGGLATQVERTSDEAVARFEVKSPPAGVGVANATVYAPDGTRASRLVSIENESLVLITLPRASGDVKLRRPGGWRDARWPRLVSSDGSAIPVPTRPGNSTATDDETVVLRQIPAGRWRYVEARGSEEATLIGRLRFLDLRPVSEFDIEPGKVVEITLPAKK